jgi:hypothetical protein
MESAVTDLPDPDSPTIPTVSPWLISNETESTAVMDPSSILNVEVSSFTDSNDCLIPDDIAV